MSTPETPLDDSTGLDEVLLGFALWARPVIKWLYYKRFQEVGVGALQEWIVPGDDQENYTWCLAQAAIELMPYTLRMVLFHLLVQDDVVVTDAQAQQLEHMGWLQRTNPNEPALVPKGATEAFLPWAKLAIENETWEKSEAQKKEAT